MGRVYGRVSSTVTRQVRATEQVCDYTPDCPIDVCTSFARRGSTMHILGRVTYQKHGCQRRHSWHYTRASTLIQLMCLAVAEQARVSR